MSSLRKRGLIEAWRTNPWSPDDYRMTEAGKLALAEADKAKKETR